MKLFTAHPYAETFNSRVSLPMTDEAQGFKASPGDLDKCNWFELVRDSDPPHRRRGLTFTKLTCTITTTITTTNDNQKQPR